MRHRAWTWIEDYYSKIGGKDMEKSALGITDGQKQKLIATILQDGTTALDYVMSWPKADQRGRWLEFSLALRRATPLTASRSTGRHEN